MEVQVSKNRYKPNEVIFEDDVCYIKLWSNKNKEFLNCVIDTEDYDKVKDIHWRLDKRNYPINNTRSNDKNLYIYRNILDNYNTDDVIDHINRNPLDNRKCNLRITDKYNNDLNRGLKSDNTSGITGVCWHKKLSKWRVRVNYLKKEINIGYFDKFIDAVKMRLIYEWYYFDCYSSHYNNKNNKMEIQFINLDNNKNTFMSFKIPSTKSVSVSEIDIEEYTYEELLKIPSKRGFGMLGSSSK